MTIALDTDILGEILVGNPVYAARAAASPRPHAVPIVVVEEIMRGRLNAIRQAEAGKGRVTLIRAYELFQESVADFRRFHVLPYTQQAELQFGDWRAQKVRVATHDLRIAAIATAHGATLISRNRRDFERVPGLAVEYWD